MKNRSIDIVDSAKATLLSCIAKVPFLKVVEPESEYRNEILQPDILLQLKFPEKRIQIIAEVKTSGQPRLARDAVNQLLRYREYYPESYGVFIAPYISPRAAKICLKEDVGYVDLSGNCRLTFDKVYIEKEGNPNKFKEKRALQSLFSPKAERILRVLLCNPGKKWKIKVLANISGVSLGLASNVKRLLYDQELISGDRGGFKLEQPKLLLNKWVENYNYRKNEILEFYSLKNIATIEKELSEYSDKNSIKYALTGFSGAARIAPSVRYKKAMFYAADIPEKMIDDLSLKKVESGGNLLLFIPYDDGIFYLMNEYNGIKVVSLVQLYLDLKGFRGRGEEAAEALFERIFEKSW